MHFKFRLDFLFLFIDPHATQAHIHINYYPLHVLYIYILEPFYGQKKKKLGKTAPWFH